MPRGPDLSPNEVAMVHSKIKQFWNYEKAEFYHNLFAEPGGVYDSIEAKK